MRKLILGLLLLAAPAAFGQASRTWLDGLNGDDANPCSRLAPCKTFAGAMSKTATNGEIDVATPGSFGAVTVVKSITLDGAGTKSGILSTGTSAIVVNAADAHVIIRNLDLNGFNTGTRGIYIVAAANVTVENCTINGFLAEGIRDVRNPGGNLTVRNTTINGGTYGVLLISPATNEALLENVSIRGASTAGARSSGGNGRLHIVDSSFVHNGTGVLVDTSEAWIERSQFAYNTTGVDAAMAGTIRLSECSIQRNTTGVAITGLVESFGHNRIRNNTGGNGAGISGVLEQ